MAMNEASRVTFHISLSNESSEGSFLVWTMHISRAGPAVYHICQKQMRLQYYVPTLPWTHCDTYWHFSFLACLELPILLLLQEI